MTSKVAVSLPTELFERLEAARKRAALSRSAVFQHALDQWLCEKDREQAVADYVEGYCRSPEDLEMAEAWAGVEAWGAWKEE